MKLIAVKCPQCSATLDIDQSRKTCFCSYCGTKIILDDGSHTITHIYIDKTRERELEFEAKRIKTEQKKFDYNVLSKLACGMIICVALILVLIVFALIKNEFNIMFNFCTMLVGYAVAVVRFKIKSFSFATFILSLVLCGACVAYIIMRNDFNSTFTITFAIVVAMNIIATVKDL